MMHIIHQHLFPHSHPRVGGAPALKPLFCWKAFVLGCLLQIVRFSKKLSSLGPRLRGDDCGAGILSLVTDYRLLATLFLAACSSGPEAPVDCTITAPCTHAPVKATSRPYQIKGVWYYPQPHYEYDEVGVASYYGGEGKGRYKFQGRRTATGAVFDMNSVSAAHKTLPLPCVAEVCNLENGRQIVVTVNDRGPFVGDRMLDVSRRVAQLLGFEKQGTAKVRVRTLVSESLALNGMCTPPIMFAQATPPPSPVIVAPRPVVAAPSLIAAAQPLPAHPTAPMNTGIFVDVGRHETQAEAIKFVQHIPAMSGLQTQPVKHNGPTPYALRVGPLASLSAADQLLDKLTAAGCASRIIIQR